MRARGLDRAVASTGARVLGICGGCQMLGRSVDDPHGIEGGLPGRVDGLALLPFDTVLAGDKVTRRRDVGFPDDLPAPWAALAGLHTNGYEIRLGRTSGVDTGPVWAADRVLATTVHGLLEDPDVVERLVGRRPAPVLDATFDLLADVVDEHLDTALLRRLTGA
jgi:adenosylcobyric acid synthase